MKNCNRYNYGGMVPGAIGLQDFGQGQYGMNGQVMQNAQQFTPEQLAQLAGQIPGAQPPSPQTQQRPRRSAFDSQGLMNAAALGALAGFGGKGGVIAAPIMALLAQWGKGKFGKAPTTARTPSFVDDGRQGG